MSTSERETGRGSRRGRCPCLFARDQGYNGYAYLRFFFFYLCVRFWSWVNVLRTFFLTFRRVGGSEKRSIVCILSIAVWRGAFCLRSWPKTKFGEETTGSQWGSLSWSEESWPELCAHDDGNSSCWIMRSACKDASTKMCTLKKKFLMNSGR